jgi:hypothetical protein
VNKDVWAHLLGDEAEDSVVMPEPGPGIDADMAQLPQDHLLGGYKRPRVATSLSSTGGDSVDDLRFLSNGEGLVNGFLSLELSQFINQPGVRPREIPGPRPQAIIRCRACSSPVQPGAARCSVTPVDACCSLCHRCELMMPSVHVPCHPSAGIVVALETHFEQRPVGRAQNSAPIVRSEERCFERGLPLEARRPN